MDIGEADVSVPVWRKTVAIMETNTEYIAAQPNTIETVCLHRRRLYAFLRAYQRPYMTQVICRGVGAFEDQRSLLETCVHLEFQWLHIVRRGCRKKSEDLPESESRGFLGCSRRLSRTIRSLPPLRHAYLTPKILHIEAVTDSRIGPPKPVETQDSSCEHQEQNSMRSSV